MLQARCTTDHAGEQLRPTPSAALCARPAGLDSIVSVSRKYWHVSGERREASTGLHRDGDARADPALPAVWACKARGVHRCCGRQPCRAAPPLDVGVAGLGSCDGAGAGAPGLCAPPGSRTLALPCCLHSGSHDSSVGALRNTQRAWPGPRPLEHGGHAWRRRWRSGCWLCSRPGLGLQARFSMYWGLCATAVCRPAR